MKKGLLLSAAAGMIVLAACQPSGRYTVKGTAEGVADGEYVYLQSLADGNFEVTDSAVVKGGMFEFKAVSDSVPTPRYISYNAEDGSGMRALFFAEDGTITVNMGMRKSRISGTEHNDIYQRFADDYTALDEEATALWQTFRSDTTLTDEKKDSLKKVLEAKEVEAMDNVYKVVAANITNVVGVTLLNSYSYALEPAKIQPLLEQIPAAYAGDKRVVGLKLYVEKALKTAVGQDFTDIVLDTPGGETLKLSDVVKKNKYTLVDFWASWCGPCRAEMPNVVAAYAKFHKKGLEIVGVSLDNNAESWKKAIKDLNMEWVHISDLKGWECEGASLYGVRSIPATVLIGQDGKIVARNLRGGDLEKKLAELLK